MRSLAAGTLVLALLAAAPIRRPVAPAPRLAQGGTLLVRVLDAVTGRPLPNAEVGVLDTDRRWLTDASGEARVTWPGERALRLRIRQLGYRFVERTVRASGAPADTAVFALERAAFRLPEVRAEAMRGCEPTTDSVAQRLSVLGLEHLKLAADHYDHFQASYPFDGRVERRTALVGPDGKARKITVGNEWRPSEQFGGRYERGRVLRRLRAGQFSAPLMFVTALADAGFWEAHCLVVRGIESRDDRRLIALDFAPVADVDSPDWAGTAWIDSASSVLWRLDFRLVNLGDRGLPRRLLGYTTFATRSAYITGPDSTVVFWWERDPPADSGWGTPDVVQLLHVTEIRYRKGTPP